jgi:hypothetical protein
MTAIDIFELVGWASITLAIAFGVAIPVLIVWINRSRMEDSQ